MQVASPGGQVCYWFKYRHPVAKFVINACGAMWWPNLQPIKVVPLKSISNYSNWKICSRQDAGRRGDLMAQEHSSRKEDEAFFSAYVRRRGGRRSGMGGAGVRSWFDFGSFFKEKAPPGCLSCQRWVCDQESLGKGSWQGEPNWFKMRNIDLR